MNFKNRIVNRPHETFYRSFLLLKRQYQMSEHPPRQMKFWEINWFHPVSLFVCLSVSEVRIHCLQLLLNDLQDFDLTWLILRLHNGDLDLVRNLILTIFGRKYGYFDFLIFTSIWVNALSATSIKRHARFW